MPLRDSSVTRLPNGIGNVSDVDIFNALHEPDEGQYIRSFDDFSQVVFAAANYTTGGVGTPTRAAQAGVGGLVRLSGSAASGDNSWLQSNLAYQPIVGKKLYFSARLAQIDDATNGAYVAGIQVAVAANNFLTPANGIFFRKSAAQTGWELVSRAASVETTTGTILTAAAATAYRLQFFFDGVDSIWAAINGAVLARITPAALPAAPMGAVFGEQNGTAVARNMDVDQYQVYQER